MTGENVAITIVTFHDKTDDIITTLTVTPTALFLCIRSQEGTYFSAVLVY